MVLFNLIYIYIVLTTDICEERQHSMIEISNKSRLGVTQNCPNLYH